MLVLKRRKLFAPFAIALLSSVSFNVMADMLTAKHQAMVVDQVGELGSTISYEIHILNETGKDLSNVSLSCQCPEVATSEETIPVYVAYIGANQNNVVHWQAVNLNLAPSMIKHDTDLFFTGTALLPDGTTAQVEMVSIINRDYLHYGNSVND